MQQQPFVVVTDYGNVHLSPKVISYLDATAPNWQKILHKKPKSKKDMYATRVLGEIEVAVSVCAAVEWVSGGVLEQF